MWVVENKSAIDQVSSKVISLSTETYGRCYVCCSTVVPIPSFTAWEVAALWSGGKEVNLLLVTVNVELAERWQREDMLSSVVVEDVQCSMTL